MAQLSHYFHKFFVSNYLMGRQFSTILIMNKDAKTLIFILFDIMFTHIISGQITLSFCNIIPSSEYTHKNIKCNKNSS